MTKVALIVGGSRGIGAATALLAGERGYDVAITYASNAAAAESIADKIRACGRKAVFIQADSRDEDAAPKVFAAVTDKLGPVDLLVYNSGITGSTSQLVDASNETIRNVMTVNALGAIFFAKEAARRMGTSRGGAGGNIVFVSSRSSELGSHNAFVWYGASKGAVDSLTIGLARELGVDGIRVNAVSPGPIKTDMTNPARSALSIPTTALKRMGQPQEVAPAIMFLASDEASYITGAILQIGGGR